MSIYSLKAANVAAQIAKLDSNIKSSEVRKDITTLVRNNMGKFSGKLLTKRVETHLKELLGKDYTTHFSKGDIYSAATIYIWGNGIDYSYRLSINFVKPADTFNNARFQLEMDTVIAQFDETINKAKAGKVKGEALMEEWNSVLKDLLDIHNEMVEVGIHLD